jgi:hypothetical protein
MGLGSVDERSFSDARDETAMLRVLVKRGEGPIANKRQVAARRQVEIKPWSPVREISGMAGPRSEKPALLEYFLGNPEAVQRSGHSTIDGDLKDDLEYLLFRKVAIQRPNDVSPKLMPTT